MRILALAVAISVLTCTSVHAEDVAYSFDGLSFPVIMGDVEWVDVDGDGDLDVSVIGHNERVQTAFVALIQDGTVSQLVDLPLPEAQVDVNVLCSAWADFDDDGDMDVAVSGIWGLDCTGTGPIYCENDSRAILLENVGMSFRVYGDVGDASSGRANMNIAWADSDNDGDQDLIVVGYSRTEQASIILHVNQGGIFTPVHIADHNTGMSAASVAWADWDSDGDNDFAVTGLTGGTSRKQVWVYRNEGQNSFSRSHVLEPGVAGGSISWGDHDNDGEIDLLLAGNSARLTEDSFVYSQFAGQFVERGYALTAISAGVSRWADVDNDGDLDVLTVGQSSSAGGSRLARLHLYNGNDYDVVQAPFFGARQHPDVAFGDYDRDGDLDVLECGYYDLTKVFVAETTVPNGPPSAPVGLSSTVDGLVATLLWATSVDDHTPAGVVTYNLGIGTQPGLFDVMPAMALPGSGNRLVSAPGNASTNTQWAINLPGPGVYYWTVQAIDSGLMASEFAPVQMVRIGGVQSTLDFSPDTLNLGARGKWCTAAISDVGSARLDEVEATSLTIGAVVAVSAQIEDGVLVCKFPRQEVGAQLPVGMEVPVTLTGQLLDGTAFTATDTIRVIDPSRSSRATTQPVYPAGAMASVEWLAIYGDAETEYDGYISTDGGQTWGLLFEGLRGTNKHSWALDTALVGGAEILVEGKSPRGVQHAMTRRFQIDGVEVAGEAPQSVEYGVSASPNPFNPRTMLYYGLQTAGRVELTIYDLAGRRVKTLASGHVEAGRHEAQWDGRDEGGKRVASGVYLYRLVAGDFVETKRMVLLK